MAAALTVNLVSWIVIAVNIGLAGLNTYHMIRLNRARRTVDRARQQFEQARDATLAVGEDFTRRLTTGGVRVTTDEGIIGTLVVKPEGDGVRIYVQPDDKEQVH